MDVEKINLQKELGQEPEVPTSEAEGISTHLFVLRTTANREDQVVDFLDHQIDVTT